LHRRELYDARAIRPSDATPPSSALGSGKVVGGKTAAAPPGGDPPLSPEALAEKAANVSRCVALAMGSHARIGMCSRLRELPRDLLHKIAETAGISAGAAWYARPPSKETVALRQHHRLTYLDLHVTRHRLDDANTLNASLAQSNRELARQVESLERKLAEQRTYHERFAAEEQRAREVRPLPTPSPLPVL